jgi:galactokinase
LEKVRTCAKQTISGFGIFLLLAGMEFQNRHSFERMQNRFHELFGMSGLCIEAPGRINLIGEHTDYNNGFVLPCAIQKTIRLMVAPNNTPGCKLVSENFGSVEFLLSDLVPGPHWYNYVMGVVAGLIQKGKAIGGFNMYIESDIPSGAGLSSSAALCCGTGFALNEIFGAGLSRLELAMVAQQSEHEFAGLNCGIMDQYASLFGKKETALLLDCRSVTHEEIPLITADYELLLVNSRVSHNLAQSAYNNRRADCEAGVEILKQKYPVQSLRDVNESILETERHLLGNEIFSRCNYVVQEINRTQRAAMLLKENNLKEFGALMLETHWGLSRQYAVSCAETDYLVELASASGYVAGARMMGGGFGGCILNLVQSSKTDQLKSVLSEKYFARFKKEPDFYEVSPGDGVKKIS